MHVELMGCTGAGKSTLARRLVAACRQRGLDARLGEDFVLARFHLAGIRPRLLRTILVDGCAGLACAATWRRHRAYYRFALARIAGLPGTVPWLERLNLARNVVKKVGVDEIVRGAPRDAVIVVDEGTLHAAHNLFVHVSAPPTLAEVSRFAALVALPSMVVHVRERQPLLIARTLARGHRRVVPRTYPNAERFVSRAAAVFDELAGQLVAQGRMVPLDGDAAILAVPGAVPDPLVARVAGLVDEIGRPSSAGE